MSSQFCCACLMPDSGFSVCPHCGWRAGEPASNPLYLTPGTVLNSPYQVARVLGHGGFGITYLGWDANLQIKVAIKEYLPRDFAHRDSRNGQVLAYSGDARQHFAAGLQQFLDEARTLAKFQQHPGIVSVLTFFRAFGTGYMVMEYIEGETLKNYLQRRQERLNWQQTLDIFMHVMDALRAVHGVGLLHRDIAPDNIYLCTDGRIKLLDFGAARHAVGGDSRSLMVVKPGFAPEEQYRTAFEQGPWSDVYSVAASVYFCLTGQTPPDALDRAAHDTLKTPVECGVVMPVAAEQALLGALAVKAWQRPQSVEALQQQLIARSNSQAGHSRIPILGPEQKPLPELAVEFITDQPLRRGRRWLMIFVLAAVLLILVYNLVRTGIEKRPVPVVTKQAIKPSRDDTHFRSPVDVTENIDWASQREREREAAEALKQQQAAALRRFEEYRRQETSSPESIGEPAGPGQEHLRSLCDEWGATMDCKPGKPFAEQ